MKKTASGFVLEYDADKPENRRLVTCKNCGVTDLHWVNLDEKWRLYDGEEPHECPVFRRPSSASHG